MIKNMIATPMVNPLTMALILFVLMSLSMIKNSDKQTTCSIEANIEAHTIHNSACHEMEDQIHNVPNMVKIRALALCSSTIPLRKTTNRGIKDWNETEMR